MSDLADQYQPRWLYLNEFADSLPDATDDEKQRAIALLVSDRLIVDGQLNERDFRFLGRKPDISDATWLTGLSALDFVWEQSLLMAPAPALANSFASDNAEIVIEIAASALSYFGQTQLPKRSKSPAPRVPQEQRRAVRAMNELFGSSVPTRDILTDADLHSRVNKHVQAAGGREISKDTVLRAAKRRSK